MDITLTFGGEPEPEPEAEDSAEAKEAEPSEAQQALLRIQELSPNLRVLNRSGRPILSLPEAPHAPDKPDE